MWEYFRHEYSEDVCVCYFGVNNMRQKHPSRAGSCKKRLLGRDHMPCITWGHTTVASDFDFEHMILWMPWFYVSSFHSNRWDSKRHVSRL